MIGVRADYPYPPSWIDRFTVWVERLPGRFWVFYVALGLMLAFISTAVDWVDGSYPIGTLGLKVHCCDHCGLYLLYEAEQNATS